MPTAPACRLTQRTRIRHFACSRSTPSTTYWHRLGTPFGPALLAALPAPRQIPNRGKPGLGHPVTIPSRLVWYPTPEADGPARAAGAAMLALLRLPCSPVAALANGLAIVPFGARSCALSSFLGITGEAWNEAGLSLRL